MVHLKSAYHTNTTSPELMARGSAGVQRLMGSYPPEGPHPNAPKILLKMAAKKPKNGELLKAPKIALSNAQMSNPNMISPFPRGSRRSHHAIPIARRCAVSAQVPRLPIGELRIVSTS